jgi:hypothetical protein
MGARSSPEGYRVAVGRYGLPVRTRAATRRRWSVAAIVLVPVVVASCSRSGGAAKSSTSGRPAACTYVAKLDAIAASVARANVQDPTAFKATLATAVAEYVADVKALKAVAPADLDASLDLVAGDVQQFRFDAALTDRTQLDAYAARECGRVGVTPTTAPLVTSTTSGAPNGATTTTNALGSTATTAPSD